MSALSSSRRGVGHDLIGPLLDHVVGELAAEVGAAAARWEREGGFVIGELREVWAGR